VQFLDLLFNLFSPAACLEMKFQQILQIRVRARNGIPPPAFKFIFSSHASRIALPWERSTSG